MKIIVAALAALCLASCYAVTENEGLSVYSRDTTGLPVVITPASGRPLSTPAVLTSKGILAYDRDLQSCRGQAGGVAGTGSSEDDADALSRIIGSRPIGRTVTINQEFDDVATNRDALVKQCLSKRGYIVRN